MTDELQERVAQLEEEVRRLKGAAGRVGVRKRSTTQMWGRPLWEIALGPDPDTGELRGHARAILAVGDMATGVVALGGLARGGIAIGGVAVGLLSLGGVSLALLTAVGGLAIGGLALGGGAIGGFALGGGAVGYAAMGAAAAGHYAAGDGTYGTFVVNAARQDPEAVRFFTEWVPGFHSLLEGLLS